MWEELEGHIKKVVVGVEKEREGGEKRGWWDEEYKERKKEVRKPEKVEKREERGTRV